MTREEARAFIEEAEKLPANEVDTAKLTEAIEVLSGSVLDLDPLFEGLHRLAANFDENLRSSLAAIRALGVFVGDVVGKVAGVAEPFLEDVGRIQTAGPRFENAEWLARAGQLAREVGGADQEPAAAAQAAPSDFGVQFNRRLRPDTARVDRLDPAFRKRLTEAAAGADVSAEEVEALIGQGMTYLARVKESNKTGVPLPPDSPTTIEQFLQPYIETWESEVVAPRPIGVPFDFVASREDPDALSATRGAGPTLTRTQIRTVEPKYFEGDELAPASTDPSFIAKLQRRLVAAGLLKEDDYYAGYWDDLTAAAYYKALGYSNVNGTDVSVTIDRLIATLPESIKDAEEFPEPPYLTPDYATLAQRVKSVFRTDLRREPTTAEMLELTRTMGGFDRESFDAQVAAERTVFDESRGVFDPSRIVAPGGAGGITLEPQTFQNVDPAARFQELFEQRFKPEIDRLDSLGEVRRNTNNVYDSLRTMSSLVGGPSR